jgi:hypothetical protein
LGTVAHLGRRRYRPGVIDFRRHVAAAIAVTMTELDRAAILAAAQRSDDYWPDSLPSAEFSAVSN